VRRGAGFDHPDRPREHTANYGNAAALDRGSSRR
jgi:hypothetical protein